MRNDRPEGDKQDGKHTHIMSVHCIFVEFVLLQKLEYKIVKEKKNEISKKKNKIQI